MGGHTFIPEFLPTLQCEKAETPVGPPHQMSAEALLTPQTRAKASSLLPARVARFPTE